MTSSLDLWFAGLLSCPTCHEPLINGGDSLECKNRHRFPVIDGIPVLIDEGSSVFSINQFVDRNDTFYRQTASPFWRWGKRLAVALIPNILDNLRARQNYARLAELLARRERPVVFVVGGGTVGMGMEDFIKDQRFRFIESDVAFAPRTQIIMDGHSIPLVSECCDAVIAQGVLEHVVDPERVVSELVRILKPDGFIYAETPFMQGGHFAPYDFRRFTAIGHRRMLRNFATISEGMCIGPAASALWNFKSLLVAITPTRRGKTFAGLFAHAFFFLKWFDYILIDNRKAWDAASMFYFLGQKSEEVLTDRELIKLYTP